MRVFSAGLLVSLLLSGTGCASYGAREAARRWQGFTPQSLSARLIWSDGQESLPGGLIYSKPFNLKAWVSGRGQISVTQKGAGRVQRNSIALTTNAWRGGIDLRVFPPISDDLLLGYIARLIDRSRKSYDVERVAGPEIGGRASVMLTLRPKASMQPPALAAATDRIERYWFDAQYFFPLRYALLGPDGSELYGWEMAEVQLDQPIELIGFHYFPPQGWYNTVLTWPEQASSLGLAEVRQRLGYPLFELGAPFTLQQAAIEAGRPILDYSVPREGTFAVLLQAPLVPADSARIELEGGPAEARDARSERLGQAQDFGPANLGVHSLQLGNRTVTYDNYFGIKAFGWTEEGHALTLLTTGDFREALAAIASGRLG
jgi:hypothetical protein